MLWTNIKLLTKRKIHVSLYNIILYEILEDMIFWETEGKSNQHFISNDFFENKKRRWHRDKPKVDLYRLQVQRVVCSDLRL